MARGDRGSRRGDGGRGGRGGRTSGPMSREVQVSKKLSKLLRHHAENEGLRLGKGGYINLADVLENRNLKSLSPRPTLSEIQSVVATNEKQRFSLITAEAYAALSEPTPSSSSTASSTTITTPSRTLPEGPEGYYIRANQGHSFEVSLEDLLTPLTLTTPASEFPRIVVHGTRRQVWGAIIASGGLKPMERMHVHFAQGVPDAVVRDFALDAVQSASDVAQLDASGDAGSETSEAQTEGKSENKEIRSGMRNSSTLLIFIDVRKALANGVPFYISENGVVLSPGVGVGNDADGSGLTKANGKSREGVVSSAYFSKVVERGGKVIWRDGSAVP